MTSSYPTTAPADPEPSRPRSRRTRLFLRLGAAVVLGLLGAWLGLTLGGTVHHEVGPLDTSMRVEPTWGGGTVVDIPPLGQLQLSTHSGPLGVRATLDGVDLQAARKIVKDPQMLSGSKPQAERDLRAELESAVLRSVVVALLGAALLSALVIRRVWETVLGAGTAAVAMAASFAVAFTTWNPTALAEPRYTGLLTSAPSVVGNAETIVSNFSVYGDQLARIVQNVSGLYTATSHLPLLPPENDLVRVLHVSDLHLAPQAWDLIRTVVRQYGIDVVVDSGDITDHGSRPEDRYLQEIRKIPAPYVWVRGNHDSAETEKAMKQIPNVRVLDGKVRTVAGLRMLGAGDPSFTPDKAKPESTQDEADIVAREADALATAAQNAGGVDMMVYHDPAPEQVFDGLASTVLTGHLHYRKVTRGEQGTWMLQEGSTGGSGLRALEPTKPANVEMSVLYVDRSTGALRAHDDITLGGLGLASAQITRHVVESPTGTTDLVAPQLSPQPSGSPQPSPSSHDATSPRH
ncbi:MAG: metallophosphoesterase family protein [Nocardioidaceae bacterium]